MAPSAPGLIGTSPRICKARLAHRKKETPLLWNPRSPTLHASTTVTESDLPTRPLRMETWDVAKKAGITFITVAARSTMERDVRRGKTTGAGAGRRAADITTRARWRKEVGRGNIGTITPTDITERAMEWSALGARAKGDPGIKMARVQERGKGRGAPEGRTEVMEEGGGTSLVAIKLSPHWMERRNKEMERKRRESRIATGKILK